jgi:hypothetical protein
MVLLLLFYAMNRMAHSRWEDVIRCPALADGPRLDHAALPLLDKDGLPDGRPVDWNTLKALFSVVFLMAGYPNVTPHSKFWIQGLVRHAFELGSVVGRQDRMVSHSEWDPCAYSLKKHH